jgi:hypothetical protein
MKINDRLSTSSNLLKLVMTLCILIINTGCQSTHNGSVDSQYSQYYLWIKSLSLNELLDETNKQKNNIASGYFSAEVNLAMLYALPNSPIYNPYTAKTKLNKLAPNPLQAVQISSTDFGFITMMKDQLNQQILTLNKLLLTEQKSQKSKAILEGNNIEHDALRVQFLKLKQQIKQLKKIELDINEQEQKL